MPSSSVHNDEIMSIANQEQNDHFKHVLVESDMNANNNNSNNSDSTILLSKASDNTRSTSTRISRYYNSGPSNKRIPFHSKLNQIRSKYVKYLKPKDGSSSSSNDQYQSMDGDDKEKDYETSLMRDQLRNEIGKLRELKELLSPSAQEEHREQSLSSLSIHKDNTSQQTTSINSSVDDSSVNDIQKLHEEVQALKHELVFLRSQNSELQQQMEKRKRRRRQREERQRQREERQRQQLNSLFFADPGLQKLEEEESLSSFCDSHEKRLDQLCHELELSCSSPETEGGKEGYVSMTSPSFDDNPLLIPKSILTLSSSTKAKTLNSSVAGCSTGAAPTEKAQLSGEIRYELNEKSADKGLQLVVAKNIPARDEEDNSSNSSKQKTTLAERPPTKLISPKKKQQLDELCDEIALSYDELSSSSSSAATSSLMSSHSGSPFSPPASWPPPKNITMVEFGHNKFDLDFGSDHDSYHDDSNELITETEGIQIMYDERNPMYGKETEKTEDNLVVKKCDAGCNKGESKVGTAEIECDKTEEKVVIESQVEDDPITKDDYDDCKGADGDALLLQDRLFREDTQVVEDDSCREKKLHHDNRNVAKEQSNCSETEFHNRNIIASKNQDETKMPTEKVNDLSLKEQKKQVPKADNRYVERVSKEKGDVMILENAAAKVENETIEALQQDLRNGEASVQEEAQMVQEEALKKQHKEEQNPWGMDTKTENKVQQKYEAESAEEEVSADLCHQEQIDEEDSASTIKLNSEVFPENTPVETATVNSDDENFVQLDRDEGAIYEAEGHLDVTVPHQCFDEKSRNLQGETVEGESQSDTLSDSDEIPSQRNNENESLNMAKAISDQEETEDRPLPVGTGDEVVINKDPIEYSTEETETVGQKEVLGGAEDETEGVYKPQLLEQVQEVEANCVRLPDPLKEEANISEEDQFDESEKEEELLQDTQINNHLDCVGTKPQDVNVLAQRISSDVHVVQAEDGIKLEGEAIHSEHQEQQVDDEATNIVSDNESNQESIEHTSKTITSQHDVAVKSDRRELDSPRSDGQTTIGIPDPVDDDEMCNRGADCKRAFQQQTKSGDSLQLDANSCVNVSLLDIDDDDNDEEVNGNFIRPLFRGNIEESIIASTSLLDTDDDYEDETNDFDSVEYEGSSRKWLRKDSSLATTSLLDSDICDDQNALQVCGEASSPTAAKDWVQVEASCALSQKHGCNDRTAGSFSICGDKSKDRWSIFRQLQKLHNSIFYGDKKSFNEVLNPAKSNLNHKNNNEIELLLMEGNDMGRTALHLAVMESQLDMARSLLDKGGAIVANVQDSNGETPLHLASNVEIIELLLRDGHANPNIPNADGLTPLHLAVQRWDAASVRVLLEHNADVNCADNIRWLTPLHLIALLPGKECHSGSNVSNNVSNNVASSRRDETKDQIETGSFSNYDDNTRLQIAELLCSAAFLCKSVRTSNAKSSDRFRDGRCDPIRTDHIGSTDPDLNYEDCDGNTPLHYAVQLQTSDIMDICEMFVECGSNPKLLNRRHQSPLHLLCHNNERIRSFGTFHTLCQLLLSHGADVNQQTLTGCTALHLTLYHQDIDSAIYLVQNGAKLHLVWKKPKQWPSFWQDMGSADVVALDMITDNWSLQRILESLIEPQQLRAPSRPWCMHCKTRLGTFSRAISCKQCGRYVCGACCSSYKWTCATCEQISQIASASSPHDLHNHYPRHIFVTTTATSSSCENNNHRYKDDDESYATFPTSSLWEDDDHRGFVKYQKQSFLTNDTFAYEDSFIL